MAQFPILALLRPTRSCANHLCQEPPGKPADWVPDRLGESNSPGLLGRLRLEDDNVMESISKSHCSFYLFLVFWDVLEPRCTGCVQAGFTGATSHQHGRCWLEIFKLSKLEEIYQAIPDWEAKLSAARDEKSGGVASHRIYRYLTIVA